MFLHLSLRKMRSKLDGETIGDSSAVKQDDPEG